METDREALAHYETPAALAEMEGNWPEWVVNGYPMRLRYCPPDKCWSIELFPEGDVDAPRWVHFELPDDHTALSILERDCRLKLASVGVSLQAEGGGQWTVWLVAMRYRGYLADGEWRSFDGPAPERFPTYDAALLAGLAAATEQGESK